MRMRALYASNYFTAGPPARRFDNPYFIPSTQVLLQQLVNKGKAVTPPAVSTPPPRPTAVPTITPAAPDAQTAGATGAERAPPVNPPESNKAAAIQKAFNKSVADQKARNKAKKDAKELADYLKRDQAEKAREAKADAAKVAFGKKQGEKTKLKNARATKIQNDFNKAVADQLRKKAGKTAPQKAPSNSAEPEVRDSVYPNLNNSDAKALKAEVRERDNQKALYQAEGLKESMLIKATPRNMRGTRFNEKMLKFRQNQATINVKIKNRNNNIQALLNKAKKSKGTTRRIVPGTGTKGYRSGKGQTNLRGGG